MAHKIIPFKLNVAFKIVDQLITQIVMVFDVSSSDSLHPPPIVVSNYSY